MVLCGVCGVCVVVCCGVVCCVACCVVCVWCGVWRGLARVAVAVAVAVAVRLVERNLRVTDNTVDVYKFQNAPHASTAATTSRLPASHLGSNYFESNAAMQAVVKTWIRWKHVLTCGIGFIVHVMLMSSPLAR